MFHKILFISFFLAMALNSFSQKEGQVFELIGTANVENGTVRLQPIGDSSYYQYGLITNIDSIRSGKFLINGSISYPIAFRIRVFVAEELIYISDIFFVQAGKNFIDINVNSIAETPGILNDAMLIYGELKSELNQIEIKGEQWADEFSKNNSNDTADHNWKSRQISNQLSIIDSMKSEAIIRFSYRYSNSFVPLWILIDEFTSGYNSSLLMSYKNLTERIQTSFTGTILGMRMAKASVLTVGNKFPIITARNLISNNEEEIYQKGNAEYTLIDFWFENCAPCLQQFHKINEFYHDYSRLYFNVIAISIDSLARRPSLLTLIQKKKYIWKQYFNASFFTNEYFITSFPRSYLIDKEGVIVKVDITPVQLIEFLNKKRNKK